MTSSLTDKQHGLIETFHELINGYDIKLGINKNVCDMCSPLACDIEHDEVGNLVGIGLCHKNICEYHTAITAQLKNRIEKLTFICHNGISDFECLRQWGIPIRDEQLVWDTYLMAHIQDSSLKAYGLKDMAKRELGIEYPSYDDIVGKRTAKQKAERVTLDKQPIELVAAYNAMDTYTTFKLYEKQKQCLV